MGPQPAGPEELYTAIPQKTETIPKQPTLFRRTNFKDPSWMTQNIRSDKKVAVILHTHVRASVVPVTTTEGYEFLCSYNWKQSTTPTIYVPGTPPKWNPPPLPKQLQKDWGEHWVDQHAERVPRFQFEPIFQALAIMNPNVRFNDVDIVVNRNTLQKLYDFASFKRSYRQFHVDLDLIGTTLFIGRKEKNSITEAQGGYGRNFEYEFTSEDPSLNKADGHHRVITYDLGGLKIVVRMEADGYLEPEAPEEPNEFFLNFLGTMESTNATIAHRNPQHTTVIPGGTLIPHRCTLELKSNRDNNTARTQTWFGRTRNLVFGRHKEGLIRAVAPVYLQNEDFEAWAVKNQGNIRRLVWLLEEIRRVVMEKTCGAAVLVAIDRGAPFQIFEAKHSFGALPKEVVERFWEKENEV